MAEIYDSGGIGRSKLILQGKERDKYLKPRKSKPKVKSVEPLSYEEREKIKNDSLQYLRSTGNLSDRINKFVKQYKRSGF